MSDFHMAKKKKGRYNSSVFSIDFSDKIQQVMYGEVTKINNNLYVPLIRNTTMFFFFY